MIKITKSIDEFLAFNHQQKQLDFKTLKAYKIDLNQFAAFFDQASDIDKDFLNYYIQHLHQQYKANTVKRKIASMNAFFNYLVMQDILEYNPLIKVHIKFKQEKLLPRIIPLNLLARLYTHLYTLQERANTTYSRMCLCRDIAIFELFLGTGMRISEVCGIRYSEINFQERNIRILGKGRKERVLQIGNETLYNAILAYKKERDKNMVNLDYFFINKRNHRLSEQSVRNTLTKYLNELSIDTLITPHMFRHTFATLLLEEDVDIRYIQQILGHSSITTTQIYTHISSNKQKEILNQKNPRNFISLD